CDREGILRDQASVHVRRLTPLRSTAIPENTYDLVWPLGGVPHHSAQPAEPSIPMWRALVIACARSNTWSLLKIFEMLLLTVFGLSDSSSAIWGLLLPSTISASTSRSVSSGNALLGMMVRILAT